MKMQHIVRIVAAIAASALITGCSYFSKPYPNTTISGKLMGQPYEIDSAKQVNASNMVVEVQQTVTGTNGITTNNFARISIGSISSVNDSNVVSASWTGQQGVTTAGGNTLFMVTSNGVQMLK